MSIAPRFLLVALASVLLAGCGDDLVGTWEGKEDPKVDLDIEESDNGYKGEGHIYLCNDSGCTLCPFDFDAKESGDERWDIDGTFKDECSSAGEFDGVECKLASDGEELHCDIPNAGTFEYERQE